MRDFIVRIQMWVLQLVLPSRGRHAGRGSVCPVVSSLPPAFVLARPEPPAEVPDNFEVDHVIWYDEPLVRKFVMAEEAQREAERHQREEEAAARLLKAHRNAALLAAEEGRDYPEVLYLQPDTPITPVRRWTGTERAVGVWG